MLCGVYVFFFKQKTAYEMRISDWSSDVCSSDLCFLGPGLSIILDIIGIGHGFRPDETLFEIGMDRARRLGRLRTLGHGPGARLLRSHGEEGDEAQQLVSGADDAGEARFLQPPSLQIFRSEEHTSELQSLMRISYAVF